MILLTNVWYIPYIDSAVCGGKSFSLCGLQPWSMRTVSCIKSWSLLAEEIWTEYFLSKWFPVLFNILWSIRYLGLNRIFSVFWYGFGAAKEFWAKWKSFFFQGRIIRPPQKTCGKAVSHAEHKQFQCPAQLQKCQPCRLRLKWHHRGQGDRQLAMQLEIVASKLAL